MIKFLGEGELMPKGYGLCYQEMHRYGFAIAPIPFNFVISLWKRFEWFCMRNPIAPKPKRCLRCYEEGLSDGKRIQTNQFFDESSKYVSIIEKLLALSPTIKQ